MKELLMFDIFSLGKNKPDNAATMTRCKYGIIQTYKNIETDERWSVKFFIVKVTKMNKTSWWLVQRAVRCDDIDAFVEYRPEIYAEDVATSPAPVFNAIESAADDDPRVYTSFMQLTEEMKEECEQVWNNSVSAFARLLYIANRSTTFGDYIPFSRDSTVVPSQDGLVHILRFQTIHTSLNLTALMCPLTDMVRLGESFYICPIGLIETVTHRTSIHLPTALTHGVTRSEWPVTRLLITLTLLPDVKENGAANIMRLIEAGKASGILNIPPFQTDAVGTVSLNEPELKYPIILGHFDKEGNFHIGRQNDKVDLSTEMARIAKRQHDIRLNVGLYFPELDKRVREKFYQTLEQLIINGHMYTIDVINDIHKSLDELESTLIVTKNLLS